MASKFSISAIFRAIDQFSSPVKKMQATSKVFSSALKSDFIKTQKSLSNFSSNFGNTMKTGVAIGAGLAIYGLANIAKSGIELASNLVEVQNVVDTTFGKDSDKINKWSKNAITQFGLSELQAKKFNGTMGAMLKSSGLSGDYITKLSTDMTGLAADFSSFYNLDSEEAFMKIRSGISGETEPLKSLGINMSVANLQAFALTQGIKKKFLAMTQGEQVMLRYNYLMNASKDAQGDFNKTLSSSYANQQRVFKNNLDSLSATIMSKLLPMLLEGFKKMNAFVTSIDGEKIGNNLVKIVNGIITFGTVIVNIIKFLIPFAPLILSIVGAIALYKTVMLAATIAQWAMNVAMTANPIGIIIVAIGILIGLIALLIINWKTISAWLIKTYEQFKMWIAIFLPGLVLLIETIKFVVKHWNEISTGIQNTISWFQQLGKNIFNFLVAPIQLALELISKIPGMGNIAGGLLDQVNSLQMKINSSPVTPSNSTERSMYSKSETLNKSEITIKDKTGKAEMTGGGSNPYFNLKLQKSGAF
jgi:hypothetical protein